MSDANLSQQSMFHLAFNVSELERSVAFYRILFDAEPAKRYPDYAKFELADPPVIFSLVPQAPSCGMALAHVGLRLADVGAVQAISSRLEAAGLKTQTQECTRCGYAEQYRCWVSDPDGNFWAFYAVARHVAPGEIRRSLDGAAALPKVTVARNVWEHFANGSVPEVIPHADGELDEVRLTGSFNLVEDEPARARLVREAYRVLRPGGVLRVHGLEADARLAGGPLDLPGPAALVRRVPPRGETAAALAAAGFVALEYVHLGDCACLEHQGVGLRETRVTAYRPAAGAAKTRLVLYKGPFTQAVDDLGNVFPSGRRVPVDAATWELLRCSSAAAQFIFLHPNDHEPAVDGQEHSCSAS